MGENADVESGDGALMGEEDVGELPVDLEPAQPLQRRGKGKKLWANVTRTHYESVRKVLREFGFGFTESDTKCVVFWADSEASLDTVSALSPWCLHNHFPGMWRICHKVELLRCYQRMEATSVGTSYNFHPKSFLLPFELQGVKAYLGRDKTMIVKPDTGSQGKGIFLVRSFDDVEDYAEPAVCQEYITPMLCGGFKFDLRIYCLVTSVMPLRLYIWNDGMARFASEPYEPPKRANLGRVFSHLTNYSLNKKSEMFTEASKRTMHEVLELLRQENGLDPAALVAGIERILVLTVISGIAHLESAYRMAVPSALAGGKSRCFEILGFDIILDPTGRPWLLEVNSMPSLECDAPVDEYLKMGLLRGCIAIMNLKPGFKQRVERQRRKLATQRMSGQGAARIVPDFTEETAIAAGTGWKLIYPSSDSVVMAEATAALRAAADVPTSSVMETRLSRHRRETAKAARDPVAAPVTQPRPGGKGLSASVVARPAAPVLDVMITRELPADPPAVGAGVGAALDAVPEEARISRAPAEGGEGTDGAELVGPPGEVLADAAEVPALAPVDVGPVVVAPVDVAPAATGEAATARESSPGVCTLVSGLGASASAAATSTSLAAALTGGRRDSARQIRLPASVSVPKVVPRVSALPRVAALPVQARTGPFEREAKRVRVVTAGRMLLGPPSSTLAVFAAAEASAIVEWEEAERLRIMQRQAARAGGNRLFEQLARLVQLCNADNTRRPRVVAVAGR